MKEYRITPTVVVTLKGLQDFRDKYSNGETPVSETGRLLKGPFFPLFPFDLYSPVVTQRRRENRDQGSGGRHRCEGKGTHEERTFKRSLCDSSDVSFLTSSQCVIMSLLPLSGEVCCRTVGLDKREEEGPENCDRHEHTSATRVIGTESQTTIPFLPGDATDVCSDPYWIETLDHRGKRPPGPPVVLHNHCLPLYPSTNRYKVLIVSVVVIFWKPLQLFVSHTTNSRTLDVNLSSMKSRMRRVINRHTEPFNKLERFTGKADILPLLHSGMKYPNETSQLPYCTCLAKRISSSY